MYWIDSSGRSVIGWRPRGNCIFGEGNGLGIAVLLGLTETVFDRRRKGGISIIDSRSPWRDIAGDGRGYSLLVDPPGMLSEASLEHTGLLAPGRTSSRLSCRCSLQTPPRDEWRD